MNTENRSENSEILESISEKDYKALQSDYTKTRQSLIEFGTELVKTKGDFDAVEDSKLKDKIAEKLYNVTYEEYLGLTGDSKLKELNPNINNNNNTEMENTTPNNELDILKAELEQLKNERQLDRERNEKSAFEKAFGSTLNQLESDEAKEEFNKTIQSKLELVNPDLDYNQKLELVQSLLWVTNSNSVNALRDVHTLNNALNNTQPTPAKSKKEEEGLSDDFMAAVWLI